MSIWLMSKQKARFFLIYCNVYNTWNLCFLLMMKSYGRVSFIYLFVLTAVNYPLSHGQATFGLFAGFCLTVLWWNFLCISLILYILNFPPERRMLGQRVCFFFFSPPTLEDNAKTFLIFNLTSNTKKILWV